MTNKTIHQIFFDLGKGDLTTAANGRFYQSHLMTQEHCKLKGYTYCLWTEDAVNELLETFKDGKYKSFYHQLREPIQKIDFAKYAILYAKGGIYMDLDVNIIPWEDISHLFNLDCFFVRWNNSYLPYNAILGGKKENEVYLVIIEQCQNDYHQKSKLDIYKKWRGRFVFQTTGHYMLKRALKKLNIHSNRFLNILKINSKGNIIESPHPLFFDTNNSVWYI